MRILHIDETFHPEFGYHCNPLANFQKKQGHEVTILTVEPKHLYPVYADFGEDGSKIIEQDKAYETRTGVRIVRVPAHGYVLRRLNFVKKELYAAVESVRPDIIMAHGMETITATRILVHYRKKYPLILDSHMLKMASTSRFSRLFEIGYKSTVSKIIRKRKYPVVRTQDDDYIIKNLGIDESQTRFISFGTDTSIFYPDPQKRTEFLMEKGLPEDSFVLVSTGKLNESKGGMILADALSKKIDSSRPLILVVIANLDAEYEKAVKEKLNVAPVRTFYYPVQKYMDLAFFYQIADATIFPKQCSMSFYDSGACGTPVISEDNNINVKRNSHSNGICFESNNPSSLRAVIGQYMNLPLEEYNRIRENAYRYIIQNYGYEVIAKEYSDIMIKAFDSFHEENKK